MTNLLKMRKTLLVFTFTISMLVNYGQENAAPSIHLTYYFPSSDAILKMQKIKILESAFASYFEVNWFTKGYAGLQQTPSSLYGTSNILLSSMWDPNTAGGIFSNVEYYDSTTYTSRFGGEGDGWKTINPFNWNLNIWYNIVNRSWKSNGKFFVATFINDLSTGKWLHSATLSIPDPNQYLNSVNDAFLENWDGNDVTYNGSHPRKALFKDCWNLNTNGIWEKNNNAIFNANNSTADSIRNGIYHNSFNAYFNTTEDAYCMEHGASTTPSSSFNGGRTLSLGTQISQGASPSLTICSITSLSATNSDGTTNVEWEIDNHKSPQLSTKVEIIDSVGNILFSIIDTMPQLRKLEINHFLDDGNYLLRLTIRDIFNQLSQVATSNFSVSCATPIIYLNGNASFCSDTSLTLSSSCASGNQWYLNDNPIVNAISNIYIPDISGIYKIVKSTNGCPAVSSLPLTVTIMQSPSTPDINWNGSQFSTTATGVTNQWFLNGNPISGATSSVYTPTTIGNYNVQVSSNGCSSSSDNYNLIVTGIDPSNLPSIFSAQVMPNPASNKVVVKFSETPATTLEIQLLNNLGAIIKTMKTKNNSTVIDISKLSSGIYFIRIIGGVYNQIKKLEIIK